MGNPSRSDEYDGAALDRQILRDAGYDSKAVDDFLFGGRPQRAGEKVGDQITVPDLNEVRAYDAGKTLADMQAMDGLPDDVDEDGWSKFFDSVKEVTSDVVIGARESWNKISKEVGLNVSESVEETVDNTEKAGEVLQAMFAPATRAQQAWYHTISGHGVDDIVDSIYGKKRIVGHDPETGMPMYYDPFDAALDFITKVPGSEDQAEAYETLTELNESFYNEEATEDNPKFMHFVDVMDAWAGGPERMDAFYRDLMATKDPLTMGLISLGIAGNEIIQDPLFFASDIPVLAGKGGKALVGAVTSGRMLQRSANKLAKKRTVSAMLDYAQYTGEQLRRATAQAAADPSQVAKDALSKAEYAHAKALSRIQSRDIDGPFETVTLNTNPRRNPDTIPTTRKSTYVDELKVSKTEDTLFGAEKLSANEFKKRSMNEIQTRIDDLIRREGLPSGMSPEAKGEFKALDKARKKLRFTKPEDVPEVVELEGEIIKPRTVDEVRALRDQERKAALAMDYHPQTNYAEPTLDFGDLQRRAIQGPDHAEQAGMAAEILINGGTADDVTIQNLAMPYYMTSNSAPPLGVTKDGLLDLDYINWQLRKSNKKISKNQLKLFEDPKKAEFNDTLLPKNELADRLRSGAVKTKDLLREGFDRWGSGLAPGSMRLRMTSLANSMWTRLTGAPAAFDATIGNAREMMRVMDGLDQEIWPAVRNMHRSAEAELKRMNMACMREFERFGAVTSNKRDIVEKGLFSGSGELVYKVDQEKSHQLAQLMDLHPGSDEFTAIAKDLTDDQLQAVGELRQFTEFYANKLHLPGTERYVKDYAHHVVEPKYFTDGSCPPGIRGLSSDGDLHLAFLLDRSNDVRGQQNIGAVDLLDITNRMTVHKLYTEPLIGFVDNRVNRAIIKNPRKVWAKQYWEWEKSNWKGSPSYLDGAMDRIIHGAHEAAGVPYQPQAVTRQLLALSSLSYAAHLSGNSKYFYMNMSTGLTTTGAKYGMLRSARGLMTAMSPEGQALMKATGVDQEFAKLMEYEGVSTALEGFVRGFTQKMTHLRLPLIPSIMETEATVRGMTMFAALDEVAKKMGYQSYSQALKNSDHANTILLDAIVEAERVNHYYGPGSKPPLMQRLSRGVGAAATQFLSFGPKQTEQILSMTMENPGHFVRFMMLSGWVQRMAAEQLNLNIDDYVGFGYLPKNAGDLSSPLVEYFRTMTEASVALFDQMQGEGDPAKTADAVERAVQSVDALLPVSTGMGRLLKGEETLRTGEKRNPVTGELLRKVELPQELASIVTGMQSLQEQRFQEVRKRTRRAKGEVELRKDRLVKEFFDMMEAPESKSFTMTQEFADRVSEIMDELFELGGEPAMGFLKDKAKARMRANNLEWMLREMAKDGELKRRFLHDAMETGAYQDAMNAARQESTNEEAQ